MGVKNISTNENGCWIGRRRNPNQTMRCMSGVFAGPQMGWPIGPVIQWDNMSDVLTLNRPLWPILIK